MSNLIRWCDEHRLLPLVLAASFMVPVAIALAVAWSRGAVMDDSPPVAPQVAMQVGMQIAYHRVIPGRTTQPQLIKLGFDGRRYKGRTLSGLGVQEYFMPRTSRAFDRLDPVVRSCFENAGRCRALVFPLAGSIPSRATITHAAPPDTGRMVFLLRNGRVAYKAEDGV